MTTLRARPGARLAAVLALLTVAGAGLAACGSPGPLDPALTEPQQQQLDQAWTAQLNVKAEGVPPTEMGTRVATMLAACAKLNTTADLLVTLNATCAPLGEQAKLATILPARCASPSAPCVRALDRSAVATEQLTGALEAFTTQLAKDVKDPACSEQLETTETQLSAYRNLSGAYRLLALGVEQRDKDISALGQRRIDDARAALATKGSPQELIDAFRQLCDVPQS